MTTTDWAWVAGLLEGEGCFSFTGAGRFPRITLQMTDEDIIKRVADYFDVSYGHRPAKTSKHKDVYQLAITKTSKLIDCYTNLYPFLGKRRRQKLDLFYDIWRQKHHQVIDMSKSTVTIF